MSDLVHRFSYLMIAIAYISLFAATFFHKENADDDHSNAEAIVDEGDRELPGAGTSSGEAAENEGVLILPVDGEADNDFVAEPSTAFEAPKFLESSNDASNDTRRIGTSN